MQNSSNKNLSLKSLATPLSSLLIGTKKLKQKSNASKDLVLEEAANKSFKFL